MKKLIYVFSFFGLAACGEGMQPSDTAEKKGTDTLAAALPEINLDLSDKIYFVGPDIDSSSVEIVAACDCCGSDLLTSADSSFVFISYCIEGNDYYKGKYSVSGDRFLLHFDSLEVKQLNIRELEEYSGRGISYRVKKSEQSTRVGKVTRFRDKTIFVFSNEFGTEYAMEVSERSYEKFTADLRKDSVWKKLQLP